MERSDAETVSEILDHIKNIEGQINDLKDINKINKIAIRGENNYDHYLYLNDLNVQDIMNCIIKQLQSKLDKLNDILKKF